MKTRSKFLAAILSAFLAFAGLACTAEDFDGDPLQDDPMMEDDGFDDGFDDDFDDDL